jgi:hypothetical protein
VTNTLDFSKVSVYTGKKAEVINMSSTKDSIQKILEAKRQSTQNQGSKKRADKNLGRGAQTNQSQRTGGSMVNKSV